MNHKHRATLHAVFAHPISANLDPKHVKAVLEDLGAEISHGGHGRLAVKLNGHSLAMHEAHHNLSKDDVTGLRHFLTGAGIDPERDYPL